MKHEKLAKILVLSVLILSWFDVLSTTLIINHPNFHEVNPFFQTSQQMLTVAVPLQIFISFFMVLVYYGVWVKKWLWDLPKMETAFLIAFAGLAVVKGGIIVYNLCFSGVPFLELIG